ncbi:MAG: segregation ATPase FtsK/SpoIIIE, family [Mycobacterium sp.]|nr:segregation ATPase FtsK/SpoIIIE, family [Mycobacterium sp.]
MDFVRAARLPAPHIDVGDVDVARPPDFPKPTPANPLARLLPVAMVVATVGMMALYFTSPMGVARNPMFVLFPVMMLVSALGSLAYGARGGQRSAELDEARRDYLGYLDTLDASAARTADAQHRSLWWSHPDPSALWTLVGGPRMWERTSGDADFGQVRIGLGVRPLSTPLVAPELGESGAHDPVTHGALQRLLAERSAVAELPVTIDLTECPVVVVEGDTSAARALVRAMVCQLAVFHGPSDVSVVAVVDGSSASEWDWLKWLPHHRSPSMTDAAGPARMTHRSMRQVTATTGKRVLVIVDADLAPKGGPVPEGMMVVTVGPPPDDMKALPLLRIDCSGGAFPECPDALTAMQAAVCARRLAPFHDTGGVDDATATPGTWAQLTGIRTERVSPEPLWQPRAVERRLRVPVGVDDRGDPVELDIKEAAQGGTGPHGLCVGATGSGKSEFLRTLTLGLVATHPPETLNLVLVDFKGGATFLGFERLRHVAAVITNLADEAHLVLRMRDALAGELTRRQELLRAAGNFANATAYEAARTRGATLAPLPTLFIVVDEFSELLSQHPDFIELFVAIGRVGRSLGMHLLLASQRLEEGRIRGLDTHLSYRICLKTFSAAESRAVLGTTEAFDLPNTPGVAYLKSASGDLVRFRTAFVSGPAVMGHRSDPSRSSFGAPAVFTAASVGCVRAERPPVEAGPRSVLDAMLGGLAEAGTRAHQVWLPPLTASPTLGDLIADASPQSGLVIPIGLVDNPFHQRRDVLLADLRGAGGHVAVVGGPRSGKSTTLRTLILALAATHDPAAVQVYGLDFGGGALSAVRSLPHVGAVAGRFDRELVGRIVAHLQAVVRRREDRLRRHGVDGRQHGELLLVIDGWAGVRQEFDGLEEAVTALAAQGLSVGVHVVIAAARWAELRPALKDQLGTRIELRLGDPADSELDRKRARLLADRPAGHGITRDGLELVVALPRLDSVATANGLDDAMRAAADALRMRHPGLMAPEVVPMPTRVVGEAIVAQSPARVVLGLGEAGLRPMTVDFTEQLHALIVGEPQCGKTTTLRTLCRELVRTNGPGAAQLVIVDVRRTLLGVVETEHLRGYAMSSAAAEAQLTDLAAQLRARLPHDGVTQRQLRERSWWSGPDHYVIVDDYELVSADNPLRPLLELIPHARDLGLHVIVARRSGGAARAMFDPVLTGLRELGCLGLMMSASPDEGVLLGSVRPSPLPQGRATVVRRGHPDQLVQVAWTDPP